TELIFLLLLLRTHCVPSGPPPELAGCSASCFPVPPLRPLAHYLRSPLSPISPLCRRFGCRWDTARRLLYYLQPQQAGLPPERVDLLLLHLDLVLLLTLTHIRHAVLERQIDDPAQFARRRGHGRLRPQPPFHSPQKPSQRPLAVVQTLGRQTQRLRRPIHAPTRPARLDPATRLLPLGT